MQCIVAHRPNSRAGRNCGLHDALVCSHIHTDSRREYIHCNTNSRTAQRHFETSSQETRQSNGTPGLQLSRNIQFHFRVVGAQDANHENIRVRHHSRTFASFARSVCNAEFLQPFSTSCFNSLISSSSWNSSVSCTIRSITD